MSLFSTQSPNSRTSPNARSTMSSGGLNSDSDSESECSTPCMKSGTKPHLEIPKVPSKQPRKVRQVPAAMPPYKSAKTAAQANANVKSAIAQGKEHSKFAQVVSSDYESLVIREESVHQAATTLRSMVKGLQTDGIEDEKTIKSLTSTIIKLKKEVKKLKKAESNCKKMAAALKSAVRIPGTACRSPSATTATVWCPSYGFGTPTLRHLLNPVRHSNA